MRYRNHVGMDWPDGKGYVLVTAVFVMLAASIMIGGIMHSLIGSLDIVQAKRFKLQALYNAERGINEVLYEFVRKPGNPNVSIAGINLKGQPDIFKVANEQSDLFLVATSESKIEPLGGDTYRLSGVTVANLMQDQGKTVTGVSIECDPPAGGFVFDKVPSSVPQKAYLPDALIFQFTFSPGSPSLEPDIVVLGTFTFSDGSSFKTVLCHPESIGGVLRYRDRPNTFKMRSTGKVVAGGHTYRRTVTAVYDVSYSKIKYWREEHGVGAHLF